MKNYTQWYEIVLDETAGKNIAASVIHYGGYEFLNEAYDFLISWIRENGYKIKKFSKIRQKSRGFTKKSSA